MRWDNVALIRRLEKGERRLGFAAVNAINFALKAVQTAQQDELLRRATVRVPNFTLKQIAVISPFASVGNARPYGEVSIGRRPRLFLAQMAVGGVKEHRGRNVAIAVTGEEARPTFRTAQPFPPLVKRLRFRKPRRKGKRSKPGAKVILQSTTPGYFLIPGRAILKREGERLRAVVVYKPEVRIKPVLDWLKRGREVGERALREGMEREAINAIGRGSR